MSEPENLQQKNRVVYNVQDLFFGLASGERNEPYVTGVNGEEIEVLKRIHRVTSVSYDFQVMRQDIGVLGRSSFEDNIITSPPDINVTISYSLEGLNNESKMGFNVLSLGSAAIPNKEFSSPFVDGSNKNVQQNIYLAVNQDQSDIKDKIRDPSEIHGLLSSGRFREIQHSQSTGMGMVVFQNCKPNNYSVDISLGNFPKADVSFISDNAIYLNNASGQHVPWVDTKTAKTYLKQSVKSNGQKIDAEFMVPKYYARQNPYFDPNYTFKPGDAQITIETRAMDEDSLLRNSQGDIYDFEDGEMPDVYKGARTIDSNISYAGSNSLFVDGDNQGGGVRFDLQNTQMKKDEFYTLDLYIKTDIPHPNALEVHFQAKDSPTDSTSNISTFAAIKYQDGWLQIKKRVKLDKVKKYLYIYTNTTNKNFWLDNVTIIKDSENPPLKFHSDLLQSLQLNVPLNRQNISCVGYKYYIDRPLSLPVKSTFSVGMSSQDKEYPIEVAGEDRLGNFLDNLSKDQEYDVSITFTDEQANEGMKYRIFGAKFEGVSYGLDIGSPKSHTINFSMSNDYDFGRNIISAEGRGLFVLDFLVNDSLIPLTDDQGNIFADPFPHKF